MAKGLPPTDEGHEGDLLIWMDLEMSGLDPDRERILEMATIVTDYELRVVADGPELVIHQPEEVLAAMDEWNRSHHGASGLVERVRRSTVGEAEAERLTLEFLATWCTPGRCPLAGNTVHQDRRFLERYMPRLASFLHYRNVDVSSIKELARHWYPEVVEAMPAKKERHRALEDVRESIEELRFYRSTVFRSA